MPDLVAANIDDPMMQELLKPAEDWSEIAEIIVNGGFQVPVSPTTPPLTIVPGDRQVTLTWSDLPLQQPDPYYAFLQDNPELDPDGVYRQYDFEGFRVYRSFVGPNDSHSELLADYNLSSSNLQFYYIDKLEDDEPYNRMRNGMKIWYAVVAYDANVDPATNEAFSLPALDQRQDLEPPRRAGLLGDPAQRGQQLQVRRIRGRSTVHLLNRLGYCRGLQLHVGRAMAMVLCHRPR